MAINKVKENNHVSYGTVIYTVDSASELSSVPTDVTPGSTCFVIDESKTYILNGQGEWKVYSSGGGGGGGGGVDESVITDEYDSTSTYNVGDYVIYENELYKCNTNIDIAEDWTSTHWTQTNIIENMPEINCVDKIVTTEKNQHIPVGEPWAEADGLCLKDSPINQCYDFRNIHFAKLVASNNPNYDFGIFFESWNSMGARTALTTAAERGSMLLCYYYSSTLANLNVSMGAHSVAVGYYTNEETVVILSEEEVIVEKPFILHAQRQQTGVGTFGDWVAIKVSYEYISPVMTPLENYAEIMQYDNTTSGLAATNVQDAIDEVVAGGGGSSYTEVSGTLTAGSTTLTLSDPAILTTSTFEFFTDTFGVSPTAVSVSTGSITLTFPAQQANLGVKVRIT